MQVCAQTVPGALVSFLEEPAAGAGEIEPGDLAPAFPSDLKVLEPAPAGYMWAALSPGTPWLLLSGRVSQQLDNTAQNNRRCCEAEAALNRLVGHHGFESSEFCPDFPQEFQLLGVRRSVPVDRHEIQDRRDTVSDKTQRAKYRQGSKLSKPAGDPEGLPERRALRKGSATGEELGAFRSPLLPQA